MRRFLGGVAVTLAVAVGVVGLAGFGGGGCGGHGHGRGRDPAAMAAFVNGRVDDVLDDVDATPEQRTRIHALADGLLASARDLHAGHDELHQALLAEWKADAPDRAKLHALVDARVDALRKVAHEAVDAGADAHDVLTPPQREKLAKKAERWHR